MRILITGGAGFIGSALIRYILGNTVDHVLNIDKLGYAGNLSALGCVSNHTHYQFSQIDICDRNSLEQVFIAFNPDAIIHLAAETHVDRSIHDPSVFITSNINGTYQLLEATRQYYQKLDLDKKKRFRFIQVSTDEVYGDLSKDQEKFTENTAYAPSSPYSASKASSDHLARAWHRTYGLPVIVTHCSNNYGPYQFPEKLIPLTIVNALQAKPIPIYGNGQQTREWIFVEDHVRALYQVLVHGQIGESYNIGSNQQKKNIEVVREICKVLEQLAPEKPSKIAYYADLITYVADRPGHDIHYALDASKIKNELGWQAQESFDSGLYKTISWYLAYQDWAIGVRNCVLQDIEEFAPCSEILKKS